jgi:ribosomal-protein-serine acetyltransferase
MFVIDRSTSLRVLHEDDARELFELTDDNRAYLRRWLPWLDTVTREVDTRAYVRATLKQRKEGRGPVFGIHYEGDLAGVIGFLPIDRVNRFGEIGYWLAAKRQGRGIMTQCCRFVVRYGFLTLDLHRIQIAAATENRQSRAIPERLGFKLEGVLRERENLYGTFVDHAVYALLRAEFDAANQLASAPALA